MKLDQIRYFVETAELEHLNLAAKKLRISASAVSHAIARLEEEIGQELFLKQGKNIVLTEHGRFVFKKAKTLLEHAERFADEATQIRRLHEGEISIACTHYLSHAFLPSGAAELLSANPDLRMDVKSLKSVEVIKSVVNGESDLGICFSPQSHAKLDCIPLHHGQLLCGAATSHPLFERSRSRSRKQPPGIRAADPILSQLANYPSILPRAYTGIDICMEHPMLKKHKLDQAPLMLLYDNYSVAVDFLRRTKAWSFLPDFIFAREEDVAAFPHPTAWKADFTISLITRKGEGNSRLRAAVQEALRSSVPRFLSC